MDTKKQAAQQIQIQVNEKVADGSYLQNLPPELRENFEGKDIKIFSYGNNSHIGKVDKEELLYSFFQWYTVSACNYVRLIGHLVPTLDYHHQANA